MVLYDPTLLERLPPKVLINLHRCLCRIRKNQWKTAKRRSWYYMLPRQTIEAYHKCVLTEMLNRRWKPNSKWFLQDSEENPLELDSAIADPMAAFFELNPTSIKKQIQKIESFTNGI